MHFTIWINSSKLHIFKTWTKANQNNTNHMAYTDLNQTQDHPGDSYLIRNLNSFDKDEYFSYVSKEHQQKLNLDPTDRNELWYQRLHDKEQILFMVEDVKRRIFCGKITITCDDSKEYRFEIGAGLLEEYQHQGIMSAILPKLIHEMKTCHPDKTYFARVEDSNIKSLKLMDKIGAKCIGQENTHLWKLIGGLKMKYPHIEIDDILDKYGVDVEKEQKKVIWLYEL